MLGSTAHGAYIAQLLHGYARQPQGLQQPIRTLQYVFQAQCENIINPSTDRKRAQLLLISSQNTLCGVDEERVHLGIKYSDKRMGLLWPQTRSCSAPRTATDLQQIANLSHTHHDEHAIPMH